LFAEPPPEAAKGGVNLAMESIELYLDRTDGTLTRKAELADVKAASGPRLVHFHGLWQLEHSWMSRWCRSNGVPYVVSPHGMLEPWARRHKRWKKWPYYQLVERFHLQGADRVLATSPLEAANLTGFVPEDSIQVLPLAITETVGPDYETARVRRAWDADEDVLVYLSRLSEKKGMHLLLESLAALPLEQTDRLRLVVVGDGPADYRERLRRIEDTHAEVLPPINWEGPVWGDEKWTYLQGADLFCLPTHSENFGLVVLEACQVGTPVLTTTGAPWGFLEDWDSGLVAEPNASSLRAALERYVTSFSWTTRDREQLATWTRDRFALSAVGARYVKMYNQVAAEARAARTGRPMSGTESAQL
jgi:glycosyltransferase involved in cell wall biosynthesis